jgi:hypothetical protein
VARALIADVSRLVWSFATAAPTVEAR